MFSEFRANFKTEFKGNIPKEEAANIMKLGMMFEKRIKYFN